MRLFTLSFLIPFLLYPVSKRLYKICQLMNFPVTSCDHAPSHLFGPSLPSLLLPSISLLSLALEVPVHGGGEFFPSRIRMSLCLWIHNLRWKQPSIGGRMKKHLGKAGPLSSGRTVEKCRNGKGSFNFHFSFLHFHLKGRTTLGGA